MQAPHKGPSKSKTGMIPSEDSSPEKQFHRSKFGQIAPQRPFDDPENLFDDVPNSVTEDDDDANESKSRGIEDIMGKGNNLAKQL